MKGGDLVPTLDPKKILSPEEIAQIERFEAVHERMQAPVMKTIERCVCGCDYGGNSWTTRPEAEKFMASLSLRPGVRLLDLGAGTGWPGLYMATRSGCNVTLVDLPLNGLQIAVARGKTDGISERVMAVVGDAARLPFPSGSFDAISHSDLLCCLKQKRAVLSSCRRVIAAPGLMAFTVIFVPPGLPEKQYRYAVENGPQFIESDESYETLLGKTSWSIVERRDFTSAYEASCRRQLEADLANRDDLSALIGERECAERVDEWRKKVEILGERLIQRHYLVVRPC